MDFWRLKLLLLGGLLASAGAVTLVKSVMFQMNGVAVTAHVLERRTDCYVTRLRPGEKLWTHEPLDCNLVEPTKQALGSAKDIDVVRQQYATIEFPLGDGSSFKTEIGMSAPLRPGDAYPVVYDPQSPRTVHVPLGLGDFEGFLFLFGFGGSGVLFALLFNVKRESGAGIRAKPVVAPARVANVAPARMAYATREAPRAGFGKR